jgi:hypothetical protein
MDSFNAESEAVALRIKGRPLSRAEVKSSIYSLPTSNDFETAAMANLTFRDGLINERTDPNGQRDAARNQIPPPSDAGHDRFALRRLGGDLARRMDPTPAELLGYGRADHPRGLEVEVGKASCSRHTEEAGHRGRTVREQQP